VVGEVTFCLGRRSCVSDPHTESARKSGHSWVLAGGRVRYAPTAPEVEFFAEPIVDPADASLTDLLHCADRGEAGALDQVFAVLYPELRKIAHARLRSQGGVAHLETTALVHESFLHLVARNGLAPTDRKHFFTYAAKTMRNIIIDFAASS